MLVLRRKHGEAIVLGGSIIIRVLAIEGERVKLGIEAPDDVIVVREELLDPARAGYNVALTRADQTEALQQAYPDAHTTFPRKP